MSQIIDTTKLMNQLKKIPGIARHPEVVIKGALALQKYSMENAPVKTGFLKNSHISVETEDGAEMRVQASYAGFVELGTSKWAGEPFVRPAIDEHEKDIVEAVGKELEKKLKEELNGVSKLF